MQIPNKCPACGGRMQAVRMRCKACDATIEGKFDPCPVCSLEDEDRRVFDEFMHARGNLKEMERAMRLSYPTVRARVEKMFGEYEKKESGGNTRMEGLDLLQTGKIDVEEAEELLEWCRR